MRKLGFWKIIYILLVTILGVFLILQKSIDIYWDQTYHKQSPFHVEKEELQWIQQGAFYAFTQLDEVKNKVSHFNDKLNDKANQTWFDFLSIFNAEQQNNLQSEFDDFDGNKTQTAQNSVSDLKSNQNEEQISESIIDEQELTVQLILELSETIKTAYLDLPQKQRDYFSDSVILYPKESVFFAGDSLMQGVAPHVVRLLHKANQINGVDLSKQSTGLSYPKAFNWPENIEKALDSDPSIKVLVVFLGPNDPWDFLIKGQSKYSKFKSEEWEQEYRSRIQKILDTAQDHFVKVIWVGVPCMKKSKLNQDVLYLTNLYQSEIEKANQLYLPTSELLGCQNGYSDTALIDGKTRKVRTRDGIHFEIVGQKALADLIYQQFNFKDDL